MAGGASGGLAAAATRTAWAQSRACGRGACPAALAPHMQLPSELNLLDWPAGRISTLGGLRRAPRRSNRLPPHPPIPRPPGIRIRGRRGRRASPSRSDNPTAPREIARAARGVIDVVSLCHAIAESDCARRQPIPEISSRVVAIQLLLANAPFLGHLLPARASVMLRNLSLPVLGTAL